MKPFESAKWNAIRKNPLAKKKVTGMLLNMLKYAHYAKDAAADGDMTFDEKEKDRINEVNDAIVSAIATGRDMIRIDLSNGKYPDGKIADEKSYSVLANLDPSKYKDGDVIYSCDTDTFRVVRRGEFIIANKTAVIDNDMVSVLISDYMTLSQPFNIGKVNSFNIYQMKFLSYMI